MDFLRIFRPQCSHLNRNRLPSTAGRLAWLLAVLKGSRLVEEVIADYLGRPSTKRVSRPTRENERGGVPRHFGDQGGALLHELLF